MNYKAHITKIETKETVSVDMEFPWEEGSMYWWTDGNFGCDCNRQIQFEHAKGKEYPEIECGCSEGRFSVEIELEDGRRFAANPE